MKAGTGSAGASGGPESGRRGVPLSVLLRALSVQGSWNYETLLGTGFAFVILPALRRIHGNDPAALEAALRRHEGPFNSHPYLAPLALGAVIHMEEEGEDPAVIDRFKAALRGSLGTLGDQMVWAGWRPVCLLAALTLLLLGVTWWVVLLAFLVIYNTGHLALMYWGFSVGLAEGRGVASRLGGAVRSTQPRLTAVGAFLTGLVLMLLALSGLPGSGETPGVLWIPWIVLAVAVGARWGDQVRRYAVGGVLLLAVVGLVAGVLS